MRIIDANLISSAENYVMNLLDNKLPEEYLFHSKKHTINVTENAVIIGQNSGLKEDEMNILIVSALFHDLGYIRTYDNHEAASSAFAGEFLRLNRVGEPVIETVGNAILATKVPQYPKDRISEVLCDADLMHLTSEDYFEQMELLRLEWQKTGRYNLTEYQFHLNSIDFFNHHHYHTDYGKTILQAHKDISLSRIRQRVDVLIC
jgi:uncharacterized protein